MEKSDNTTPTIIKRISEDIVCDKGEKVNLFVEIDPALDTDKVSYQWYWMRSDAKPTEKAWESRKIESATSATYSPDTTYAHEYIWYCCKVSYTTADGTTNDIYSDYIHVVVNLSFVNSPVISKQPGTFTLGGFNNTVVLDNTYVTEYYTGEQCNPIYVQLEFTPWSDLKEFGTERTITWYYNTENSTTSGELLPSSFYRSYSGSYGYHLNKSFDAGTYYIYCIIRDTDETNPNNYGETISETCKVVFRSHEQSDFTGEGTETSPYLIENQEDLQLLHKRVNEDGISYGGTYFKITKDLELPKDWTPIGCTKDGASNIQAGLNLNAFAGIIDGKISETKNATLTVPSGGLPLLGYVNGATVRNLNIQGQQIEGAGLVNNYTGPDLSGNAITIENVRVLSGTRTLYSGLVHAVYGGNQWASASAGFVVTIRNCTIEKGVTIGYSGKESKIGSFVNKLNGTIENCTSYATVNGKDYVGGIIGTMDNAMGTCVVKNSTFHGEVNASGSYAGGIVGGGYSNDNSAPNGKRPSIASCTVDGTVQGNECVGGITGGDCYVAQTRDNGTHYVTGNTFTGTVTGQKYVGGIIGYYNSLNKYDNVAGNSYSGNYLGIGFVKYIDTSYDNPKLMEGTVAFNTGKTTEGLPEIEWNTWKADLNRTDDPLGTDADKLCKKLGGSAAETPTCYELVVSGTYKTEYTAGEELDLTGIKLTAKWTVGKADTTLSLSDVEVSGYDKNKTGEQTITLSYGSAKAYIKVNVTPKSSKITVSVTIMGDSHHSDPTSNGGPHGLARGGLTTWASASVEADTTNTVWNVLQKVMDDKGITYSADDNNSYGTIYISAVNGLGEFDNGKNSGWMYTLNGVRPEVGVNAKYVSNGDKIVLFYTDDYTYEVGGVNYGKPVGQAAAEAVDKLIAAIGTVSYTDESKAKIDAARKAYDALSDSEKKLVTKLSVLEAAEKKYAELKKADDQKQATAVDNLIAAIGTVTKNSGTKINAAWNAYNALTADQKALVKKLTALQSATRTWNELLSKEVIDLIDKIDDPVTESSKDAIEAARTAYDKLTADQKKLVTNYEKLTKAETELAKLTATEEDKKKAQEVIDMIDKLGDITADSEKDVEAARKAYDALTDLQKKLVENYDKLEAAEAKLKLMKALGKVTDPYIATGDYMINLGTPSVGSIGGEWMVIGLARSDRNIPNVEDYYNNVIKYVQENIDENERLHKAKSTDNSRMILALTAIGKDVTDVDGHNLLTGLNSMDYIKKQGNNGPIWALIALDSGNYPVPEGDVTRQALIDEILRVQTSDGGWAISGDEADADMTGMALTALAPYYKKNLNVLAAVDKAIECLSQMQDADGGFSTFSGDGGKVATSESTAQVVVALTALGINPDTDSRFIKNGNSAVDALVAYFVNGGGFKHIMSGERDGMATEQSYYALTAYYRFLEEKTRLYDMTDVIDMGGDPEEIVAETTEPTVPAITEPVEANDNGSFPWAIMVLVLAAGFGGGIATVTLVLPRIKKKRF